MIVESLPDDFTTAHNYASVAVAKRGLGRLLEAQIEVVVSLHSDGDEVLILSMAGGNGPMFLLMRLIGSAAIAISQLMVCCSLLDSAGCLSAKGWVDVVAGTLESVELNLISVLAEAQRRSHIHCCLHVYKPQPICL